MSKKVEGTRYDAVFARRLSEVAHGDILANAMPRRSNARLRSTPDRAARGSEFVRAVE